MYQKLRDEFFNFRSNQQWGGAIFFKRGYGRFLLYFFACITTESLMSEIEILLDLHWLWGRVKQVNSKSRE